MTDIARDRGLRSRHRTLSDGRTTGGTPFTRGQLHYLLTNPVYLGRIRHRQETHAGLHPAIIGAEL